jgi:hypothetical protein
LDERDPDEVWTACAGFLNQSSCIYWIEALERRLVSNDSARQQRSKTVWNRLAFEVYSLLKSEPSYRSELWTRFAVMRRACLDTPAEEGISEIVKIVAETDTVATQTD